MKSTNRRWWLTGAAVLIIIACVCILTWNTLRQAQPQLTAAQINERVQAEYPGQITQIIQENGTYQVQLKSQQGTYLLTMDGRSGEIQTIKQLEAASTTAAADPNANSNNDTTASANADTNGNDNTDATGQSGTTGQTSNPSSSDSPDKDTNESSSSQNDSTSKASSNTNGNTTSNSNSSDSTDSQSSNSKPSSNTGSSSNSQGSSGTNTSNNPQEDSNSKGNSSSATNPTPSGSNNSANQSNSSSSPTKGNTGKGNSSTSSSSQSPTAVSVTGAQAQQIALSQVKGEVDDVKYEHNSKNGQQYYLVEIDTPDDREAVIQINSITGAVMSVTWDDEDDDDK